MVPLELRVGMVEGRYTPKMGRVVTRAKALMTAAEASELFKEIGVAKVSESTFDRLPKAIAARYEQHRDTINTAIRETETVPDAAVVVQVGMDWVTCTKRQRRFSISRRPECTRNNGRPRSKNMRMGPIAS